MKLLMIEDDLKIATAVKRGLEAEGYTVEVAFDGGDGLWMATEGSYDLIILDIMLPTPQRVRDLRRSAIRRRLDADPDADRQAR